MKYPNPSSFWVSFSFLVVLTYEKDIHKEICNQCSASPKVDSNVEKYCREENATGTLQQTGSCCVNTKAEPQDLQIVGVDMSSCGLKNIKGLFSSLHNLRVLMLDNNTELKANDEDFKGLSKLMYLSLPSNIQCPGGNTSWNSTEKQNSTTICLEEINLCVQDNVTCQNNNSHCVLTAPGQKECLCLPGYYGYKCLRQGTFPSITYTVILCVCTVGISGFLWCTQRRKIIKKAHTQ